MAAFALHNYVRKNSDEDLMFAMMEEYPDDELGVAHDYDPNNEDLSYVTSNEMKDIRNEIATLIWNARHG
ncbi:hypothetical protein Tco_0782699 [Tanacetum coccineum]